MKILGGVFIKGDIRNFKLAIVLKNNQEWIVDFIINTDLDRAISTLLSIENCALLMVASDKIGLIDDLDESDLNELGCIIANPWSSKNQNVDFVCFRKSEISYVYIR